VVAGAPDPDDSAAGRESVAVVGQLQSGILDVLREAEALGYEGRLGRISRTVDQTFDLAFMAEKVVGRHWKTLTKEQQQRWTQLFGDMTKANYAGRLDHYSGQSFEILGHEPAPNETMVVRTRLQDPGGEDVDLTYRLHNASGGWRIVDIYLKGTVSELALRRSEYASVLKRDGFGALLVSVNQKIVDLAAGNVDQ
jgi:phospholipid transport system substrate-binding protein